MKLTAPAGLLADTLSTAAQVCSSNASLVAYTGVLLEVSGRKLTVRGTDGDTTVAVTIALADGTDGHILVPPKPVLKYLSKLPGDAEVTIAAQTATAVEVTVTGSAPYKFTALAVPFPSYTPLRRDKVTADLTELAAAVRLVRDCAGALSGGKEKVVQLVSDDTSLRLHSTDRYRLARADLGPAASFGTFDGLLPLRVLDLVASTDPNRVQLDNKGRQLVFHNENVTVATRLAQDPYPTVESVLNVDPPHKARIPRGQAVTALRRLAAVTAPGSALRVTLAQDTATFAVNNSATGSGTETVTLPEVAGGEVTFAVNFDYVVSAFATLEPDVVTLGWAGPLSPIFVTASDPMPTTLVIMPMADEA